MDFSYRDLLKMMWNEINPIDGYVYDTINDQYKNFLKSKQILNINDLKKTPVFKNDLNNIINAEEYFRDKINGDWKYFDIDGNMQKVNIPRNSDVDFVSRGSVANNYDKFGLVENEYIKPINSNIDKIKNRIPNKTFGKLVKKILNEPIVKSSKNFVRPAINKVVTPLAIIDGLGFNSPVY